MNPHRKAFLQAFLAKHSRKPALQSHLTNHSRKAALQSVSRIRLTKLSPQIRFTKHSLKPALQSCLAKSYHKFVSQSHPPKPALQICLTKLFCKANLAKPSQKVVLQTRLAKPSRKAPPRNRFGSRDGAICYDIDMTLPQPSSSMARQLVYSVGMLSGSLTVSTPKFCANGTSPTPSSRTERTFSP